jgi:hypothetical protein
MADVLFSYMIDDISTEEGESTFIAGGAYRTFMQLVNQGKINPPQALINLNEKQFNEQFLLGFFASVKKSVTIDDNLNPIPYFKEGLSTTLKTVKAVTPKSLKSVSGFSSAHLKGKTYYVISDKMDMTVELNSDGTEGEGSAGWVSMDFEVAIDGNKHLVIDSSMMGRYSIQMTYIKENYCISADAISEDGDIYKSFWFTDEATMEKADGIEEAKALCEKDSSNTTPDPEPTPEPEPEPTPDPEPTPSPEPTPEVCAQVISYAMNPFSSSCEQFSNPCNVPSGWQSCSSSDHDETTTPTPTPEPDTDDQTDTTPQSDDIVVTIGMDVDNLVLTPALKDAFNVALQSGQMINEILALSTRFSELNDLLVEVLQTTPELEQKVCTQLSTNEQFGELFTTLAVTKSNMETYLMGNIDANLYNCLSSSLMLSQKSAVNLSTLLNNNAQSYLVTPSSANNAKFATQFFSVGSDDVHGDASEIATEKIITGIFSDRRSLNNFAEALAKLDDQTQKAYLNFIFKGDLPDGTSNEVQGYYNLYALTAGALLGSATSGEASYSDAFKKLLALNEFSYWDFGWQLWDAGKYYATNSDVSVDHLSELSFTSLIYDYIFTDGIDEGKTTQSFFSSYPEVKDLYGMKIVSKEDIVLAQVTSLKADDIAKRKNYRYNKIATSSTQNHWLYLPNTLSRESWLTSQSERTLEVGAKAVKVYLMTKANLTNAKEVSGIDLTQESSYAEATDGVYNIFSITLKNTTAMIKNADAFHIVVVPLSRNF